MTPTLTLPCFLGLGVAFTAQITAPPSSDAEFERDAVHREAVRTPEEAPLVVRIHSLHGTMPKEQEGHYQDLILPALAPSWSYFHDENERLFQTNSYDDVASLIYELNAEEFEYEGRSLQLLGDGRLLVVATEETQERVEQLLGFLAVSFGRQAELIVDVVDLPVEGFGKIPLGLVAIQEADAWIDGLAGRANHRRHRMPIRASEASVLDQSREVGVLWDYDVEIAERSMAFDPIISLVSAGLRLGVEATPAPGGVRLAMCLRDTELIGEPIEQEIGQAGSIHSENGVGQQQGPRTLEFPSLANRSAAWSTYLPEGSALIQETYVDAKTGASRRAIVLRVEGSFGEPLSHFDTGTNIGKVSLLNMGAVLPPSCRFEDSFLNRPLPRDLYNSLERGAVDGFEEEGGVAPYLRQADFDYVTDLAQTLNPEDVEHMTLGPWLIGKPSEIYDDEVDGSNRTGIHPGVLQLAPAIDPVHFRVSLSRTGQRSQVVARGNLATLVGTEVAWVLGVESSYLADIDVEVAQGSSVGDPVVIPTLDGVALQLRPRRRVDGSLCVAIDVFAHVLDESLDPQPLRSSQLPNVTRKRSTHLFHRSELVVDRTQGTWRTVLGDSNPEAKDGLALEITVR